MGTTSRGIRNNNPGNIDYNPRNKWVGQLPPNPDVEKRFAVFDKPENGIRALGKLLLNYRGKDGMPGLGKPGIDTPLEFVNRWAPSVENNTEAYARAVARSIGVSIDTPIDVTNPAVLTGMVNAIISHENGSNPYLPSVIREGVRLALAA